MISVVIPTYKKTEQLVKNLSQNMKFLKGCKVIIVNDDPSESIKGQLKKLDVKLIENHANLGFAGAADCGIKQATNDCVLLLNSDVILLDDSYKSAIRKLDEDTKLFAVSFAQKEKDGSVVGKNVLFWKEGFLQHRKADDLKAGENGWAEGGSSILSRDIYQKIGGFDQIFNPFYWEDIELSYRAKKQGYQVLFDPSVLVQHHHESTIGFFFNATQIKTIAYRNQLLCTWKYIEDIGTAHHVYFLIKTLVKSLFKRDFAFIKGFARALALLPKLK